MESIPLDTSVVSSPNNDEYGNWNAGGASGMLIGVNTFPAAGIEQLPGFQSMVFFDPESLRGETILEAR